MSLYNGPPRGGARGGKDQFNWENVKSDKDREFYLGHSVKASVGRWQKGKDLFWYTREKQDGEAAVQSELATIKAKEDELMMEALGLKPKTVRPKIQPKLDKMEMKQLLDKGDEEEGDEAGRTDADQIKGIGYRSGQIAGAGEAEREVMAGVGTSQLPSQINSADFRKVRPITPAGPPSTSKMLPPPPLLSEGDLKRLRKAQKKELKKAEKKAKKQAKKEARKDAKRAKQAKAAKRGRPDSSSGSSDSEVSGSPSPPAPKRVRTTNEGRQDTCSHDDDRRRAMEELASVKVEREPTSRVSRDDAAPREQHGSRRDGRGRSPRREHQRRRSLSPRRHPRSRSPGREHERRRHDNLVARRR